MKKIWLLALWYSVSVFSETDLFYVIPDLDYNEIPEYAVPQIFVVLEDDED